MSAAPILTVVDSDRSDDALSVDELGARIVGLAGRLAAATCRWLLLVGEFDRRDGCANFGLHSTARWLSHHCGLAHRTAVEHVRVARALLQFPDLAAEMGAGRLSYSQVRAISRVPGDGEHRTVADLIEVAEHGTAAQLETVVRGLRTVERTAQPAEEPDEYLQSGWSSQSQWRLSSRLQPERGRLVQRAIELVARAEDITHADALVRMAEMAIAAVNDSAHPPRPLRGDERAAVVVHINAADYPAGSAEGHGKPGQAPEAETNMRSAERDRAAGRIVDGPGLPKAVVDRLLCSGRIRTAVADGHGNVRDLGRSHRVVTKSLFRTLLMRDQHCGHPGCTSRTGLQAHHVRHWINGGRTDLANLILLCERHHARHHDGWFTIVARGRGRFEFLRRDGRSLSNAPNPSKLIERYDPWEAEIDVAPDAARTRWTGERLDRDWAISVLAQRRARPVPAHEPAARLAVGSRDPQR